MVNTEGGWGGGQMQVWTAWPLQPELGSPGAFLKEENDQLGFGVWALTLPLIWCGPFQKLIFKGKTTEAPLGLKFLRRKGASGVLWRQSLNSVAWWPGRPGPRERAVLHSRAAAAFGRTQGAIRPDWSQPAELLTLIPQSPSKPDLAKGVRRLQLVNPLLHLTTLWKR